MNESDGLWAVFHLEGNRYCLPGEALEAIVIPEKISAIPRLPQFCAGLLEYRTAFLPVLDMRLLLGYPSLEQRVTQFAQMKQMHVDWAASLREAVTAGTKFTKPVDPHQCQFGIWYDHFQTDDPMLKHILNRISGPHNEIHLCGARANQLLAEGQSAAEPLARAETLCRNELVPLLDRLIAAYRDANRGVVLILNSQDRQVGLLVDQTGLLQKARTDAKRLPGATAYFDTVVRDGNSFLLCLVPERLPFLGTAA